MFISHDLLTVQYISTRVAVMYLGRIVEIAKSEELYDKHAPPLLQGTPLCGPLPRSPSRRDPGAHHPAGRRAQPLKPASRMPFSYPLPHRRPDCSAVTPPLRDVGGDHQVACLKV